MDPYARTDPNGSAQHSHPCVPGEAAYRMLTQSDEKQPSVFERFRAIETRLNVAIIVVGIPLWISFGIELWDRWGPAR